MNYAIAAVAAALSYSPSAVSRQLSELQREAGVALFERDGRRLRLTGAALVLVRHADALLSRMELAEAEMAAAAGAVAGVVRVAAFQTAAINLVAPALRLLAQRHPGLRVEVAEAEPEQALEALAGRAADLALCDEYEQVPQPRPSGLAFEELHIEPVRLAVPRDHPAASGPVRLADLAGEPWAAGHPGSSHRRLVTHVCSAYGGFQPDIHHQATDLLILLALVSSGRVLTLLPDLARPEQEPAARIHDLAEVSLRRRVFTAVRPDSLQRPALTAIRDALRDAGRRYGTALAGNPGSRS